MSSENVITINGREFTFDPGETILQVAQRNGINIPTLCYLRRATPTGACRMCIVEVEGARNLVASCAMPAGPGMVVKTESPRVIEARKLNIELLLASGQHNCLAQDLEPDRWADFQLNALSTDEHRQVCPSYGDCKLQDLAIKYQIKETRFTPKQSPYPIENVNPFILRDFSRCILCGRCVQACNEVQVNNAISYGYRGIESKIVAKGDRPLKESDCVFCGECVQVCPVGALVPVNDLAPERVVGEQARKIKTTCPYCGVGCQMYIHGQEGRVVKVTGVEEIPPNYGSLCVKGRFGFDFIGHKDRLKVPLIKENGDFREASWEEALELVAARFKQIKAEAGADAIGILSSAKATNEENYLIQKFARAVIGTNNIDHCARLCQAPVLTALSESYGCGAMTNPIEDIEKARLILVVGSNTTETHPVLSSYIKRAVTQKESKLILADPRKIKLEQFAHIWLRPNLGTDVAWINGIMHVIIEEGLYDEEYIKANTKGFEDLKRTVKKYDPGYVERITGIEKDKLLEAARLYGQTKPATIVHAMGITQHVSSSDNVRCLANLAMLCGNIGIEGGGLNCLCGQNNVQGACDMGALPDYYPGYEKLGDRNARDRFAKTWGVDSLPEAPGRTSIEMINGAYEGEIKAMFIIGENPMVSDPDLEHAQKSLEKLDFLVVQDIFLTETARLAHVVLPSACFAEKEGTFTNTERRVQRIRKAIEPPGEAKEDWKIISELSGKMGYTMNYESAARIMDEISGTVSIYGGITYERIDYEGLHWPCPDKGHSGTPRLHMEGFMSGQGLFRPVEYKEPSEFPDDDYPFYLTTGRLLYHYHTGTMTMKTPALMELAPECFVEISIKDAAELGVKDGDPLRVISRRGSIEAKANVSDQAVPKTLFMPFHYAQSAANKLTGSALDPEARVPEVKLCVVRVEKL